MGWAGYGCNIGERFLPRVCTSNHETIQWKLGKSSISGHHGNISRQRRATQLCEWGTECVNSLAADSWVNLGGTKAIITNHDIWVLAAWFGAPSKKEGTSS